MFVEVNRTDPTTANLAGQVVTTVGHSEVRSVTARRSLDQGFVTESNEDGEFHLSGIPVDVMVLEVTNGTVLLRVEVDLRN